MGAFLLLGVPRKSKNVPKVGTKFSIYRYVFGAIALRQKHVVLLGLQKYEDSKDHNSDTRY